MNLLKKIENCLQLGYEINFSRFAAHFKITVSRTIDGHEFSSESQMPLDHHFNEFRICDCIDFDVKRVEEKINAATND